MPHAKPHPTAPPPPAGRPIGYWRKPPRPGHSHAPPPPLPPLSTRQSVGLLTFATMVLSLAAFSAIWWFRDVYR